jgi:hypothetical protein
LTVFNQKQIAEIEKQIGIDGKKAVTVKLSGEEIAREVIRTLKEKEHYVRVREKT